MASRTWALPLVVLVAAVAVGCGRAPSTGAPVRAAGLHQTHGEHADEPCDPAVAARIDPRAPRPRGIERPGRVIPACPDQPPMTEVASPNRNERPGGEKDVTAIVLHHTASEADALRIGAFFAKPSAKVSAHYVVGKDGMIVTCVPDGQASWHAGRSTFAGRDAVNDFSIGIEICNLGDNKDPYPTEQYQALGRLMAYLMVHHGVGWSRVTRHRDVAIPLGRKNDTSNNFDRAALEAAVVEAGGPAPGSLLGLSFPKLI